MNASEAFATFVTRVLVPGKAQRFSTLALTTKGQTKILDALCHEFESSLRDTIVHRHDFSQLWRQPCFAFHAKIGFGVEFPAVRVAYEELSLDDGWLIILHDGSAGVYRPESRWDAELFL